MKLNHLWLAVLLTLAISLPAGFALGQGMAEIDAAKKALAANENDNNRNRLAALQYNSGNKMLNENDAAGAAKMMQAAIDTLDDGDGENIEATTEYKNVRYGLAFSLNESGQPLEAAGVLERMIEISPHNSAVQYLLGVSLLRSPGEFNMNRGVKVLGTLSRSGNSPYDDMAARAVTRTLYNLSTVLSAAGKKDMAADLLAQIGTSVGAGRGASEDENNKVRFATGIQMVDSGDNIGALEQFEAVKKSDPNFASSNGQNVDAVLSNTYYRTGRDQLEAGGESAGELALEMFTKAGETGDPNATGIIHGKAAAYALTGNEEGLKKETEALKKANPEYYEKIKTEVEVTLDAPKEEDSSN